ncbi:CAP domain-containing protein [Dactylosporangium sp. NPDC051541]|uniref:CAP domain-containing protein n=1 Tax=Dactylosporangium sp. NPDC051541 TaxID=3363977 RepID=UPI0037A83B72
MSSYGDAYGDRYNPYGNQGGGDPYGRQGGGYGGQGGADWGPEPDRRPDASDFSKYGAYDGVPDGEEPPARRGNNKMLLAAGIGMIALIVVGAVAFGGSILFSKSSNSSPDAKDVAAGATTSAAPNDLLGGAASDPAASPDPTENATASAAPTTAAPPTTAAAPKTTKPTTKKTTGAPAGGGSNVAYENQVLAIVNTERAKAGCQPLTYNAKLRTAAFKHSADMAAKDYFSHDSQDGTSFAARISNEGYRWSNAAENIAKGQKTPEDVMNAWMNSSGHRANILNCKLKDLGVGLAYQGKTPIWTQDFGTQM